LHLILKNKGNISIKKITEHLHITERTLQRLFIEYVGISPKQFTKIIQFQSSVSLISDDSYQKLTDVVYETGYADQSHFIRYFKKFTGKKPSEYKTLK
jgi:AraC-like DNA-binding protein